MVKSPTKYTITKYYSVFKGKELRVVEYVIPHTTPNTNAKLQLYITNYNIIPNIVGCLVDMNLPRIAGLDMYSSMTLIKICYSPRKIDSTERNVLAIFYAIYYGSSGVCIFGRFSRKSCCYGCE